LPNISSNLYEELFPQKKLQKSFEGYIERTSRRDRIGSGITKKINVPVLYDDGVRLQPNASGH
jgi:hypothetical protein